MPLTTKRPLLVINLPALLMHLLKFAPCVSGSKCMLKQCAHVEDCASHRTIAEVRRALQVTSKPGPLSSLAAFGLALRSNKAAGSPT